MCGDVTMAGDVLKSLQHIVKQRGNMTSEEAGAFISKLRVSAKTYRKQYISGILTT